MTALRRNRRGFTLLELVIVLMVSTLVFLLAGALQSSYGKRSTDLLVRAETVRELQLAVEAMRQDAGAATDLRRWSPTALHILREAAPLAAVGLVIQGADAGVEYELVGADLIRTDLEFGGSFVTATGLTDFEVTDTGAQVVVRLAAGNGTEAKEVFLRWVR